jgi:hypothetical protein
MKYKLLCVLALTTLLAGVLTATGLTSARADYWGAWKYNGSGGNCLVAGTQIATDSSPDRHNVAASNTCHTDYQVRATLYHNDAAGRIIDSCNSGGATSTNYRQCSIQASTGTGDYWVWITTLQDYIMSCNNQGTGYSNCFHTAYP